MVFLGENNEMRYCQILRDRASRGKEVCSATAEHTEHSQAVGSLTKAARKPTCEPEYERGLLP